MAKKTAKTLSYKWAFIALAVTAVFVAVYFLTSRGIFQESPQISDTPQDDFFTNCYVSSASFPPSDPKVNPPLPPRNPLPYLDPHHVCRHFAFEFCEDMKLLFPKVDCDMIRFDRHAGNIIRFTDNFGKRWVCLVEPQTNQYYCLPEEAFNDLDFEEWLQETVCKQYYPMIPLEDCDQSAGLYEICEEIAGKTCENPGKFMRCYDPSTGGSQLIRCLCTGFFSKECTWKQVDYSGGGVSA